MSDSRVHRESIENLRTSDASTVAVLTAGLLGLHIERIDPSCVADLYAISELKLPSALAADLNQWAAKATREVKDLPEGAARKEFLAAVGDLAPAKVPGRLREAVLALMDGAAEDTRAFLEELAAAWTAEAPEVLVLPEKKKSSRSAPAVNAAGDVVPRKVAGAPKKASSARTPAAQVDPRRAEWVREDVVPRLQQYERGLKETVLVSTTVHRSPYKDLTEAEVRAELRKLERERKLKHTGDRWMMR